MMRKAQILPAAVVAILALCNGCSSDASGPTAPARTNGLSALIVSPLMHLEASARMSSVFTHSTSRSSASAAASGMSAFVSLPPGSVPDGMSAAIRNGSAGANVSADMVDGGFDPVAIPAAIGDTLFVQIKRVGSGATVSGFASVAASGAPQIVRTSPPRGRESIPLNAMILVVFSAPLDSASVDTGSIQLLRGTTRVSGTVRFADTLHLRAEFLPDSLLTLQTDYQLLVNQSIHDVNGVPLVSSEIIPFTTGASAIPSNLVFASVSVGYWHTCGVTTTGAAYCWGHNFAGELGTGSGTFSSNIPALVVGGLTFSSVSASEYHTCGVTTAGAAYCWGAGGPLGDSLGSQSPIPLRVAGGHTFTSVSAALGQSCGVTTAGAVYCWSRSNPPIPLGGGLTFASVSAGVLHSCGVTTTGAGYCWGMNTMGELGIGTSAELEQCPGYDFDACSSLPLAVSGGLEFAAVSSGALHTCGLTTSGDPYCWGDVLHDLLATGVNPPAGPEKCADIGDFESELAPDTIPCSRVPRIVAGDPKLASLSTGGEDRFACGLTSAGAAYCWGQSLVDGSSSTKVVAVPGGLTFKMLSAGLSSTCGVTTTGVAYCWGANESGELGDSTTNYSNVPVKVFGQP